MTAAQDSRAQFEAAFKKLGLGGSKETAFKIWQASRATLSAEPVGTVRVDCGEVHIIPAVRDAEFAGLRDGEAVYAAPQPAALKRKPTPASRDCTRPECMSHGCFGHCMQKVPTP